MKPMIILIALLLWTRPADAHPLHLSITNITYENGKLAVSMKTFRDDWETAYFHYHSQPVDLLDPSEREKPWFGEYLESCFTISAGKEREPFSMVVDTIMFDEESMVIEMEATVPDRLKSLYIYNALLVDIWPDQTNLVIFGSDERETGIKFDVKKRDEVVLVK
ncbi:MAG: DUF6702 family protein [Bacteroidota bacterium]